MTDNIAIVGIGETPPARRSQKDVRALVIDAVMAALDDAGIEPSEVDGIVTEASVMPLSVPHEYVAGQLGMMRYFDASISYGGAGIACAPMLAQMAIDSGYAKVVVSYFGVDWGTRPSGPYGFHDTYPAKMAFEKPYGFNAQPSYFALIAQRYVHDLGMREEHLGAVAVTQREHALAKGGGQIQKPMSMDDYFNSPYISDPLRVPDCCLISDGAGAFVMTAADRARDCKQPPVEVLGVGYAGAAMTADDVFTQKPDLLTLPAVREATDQALRRAGITREDVDFAEIYDCFTISCLMQLEDMGFCGKGEGGDFFLEGHARNGGRLPVNTHGGLLSYSYRLGIEHVTEAVRQLRGQAGGAQVKGAEIGLYGGLSTPDYGVLLLGRAV